MPKQGFCDNISVNSHISKTNKMKTPIQRFARGVSLVITLFILTFCSNDIYGQNINRKIANKAAKVHRIEAGFEKINFSKKSLLDILENAEAIKLYNGLQNGRTRSVVLMAIGLDSGGNEQGDQYTQAHTSGTITRLSRAVKDIQVSNANLDRKITAFSTIFGKEDLMALLNSSGVDGIDFMPTKKANSSGSQVLTLTAAPSGSSQEIMQMNALMSPCPPDCFQ